MEILIKRLTENASLPQYSHAASAGIDLYAREDVTIEPEARVTVPTGVALAMPVGSVGRVHNRRGAVVGDALQVTPGVIDSSYRDEVVVEITNRGTESWSVAAGENIAQLLVQQVHRANLIEAEDLSAPADS